MRVLVFADFRSPHALGWADGLESVGLEVRRVSSIGRVGDTAGEGVRSGLGQAMVKHLSTTAGHRVRTVEALARQRARAAELRAAVDEFRPDLVHALRLPYEGVCALSALGDSKPVVVSTWGQDFVAQGAADPMLRQWFRRTLPHAAALITDVEGDLDRARRFGLRDVPTMVAAANFGMLPAPPRVLNLSAPTITYTRGLTTHVDYEAFVGAMAIVLAEARSPLNFVGIGLEDLPSARTIAEDPRFSGRVRLTGKVDAATFTDLIRVSAATCSPAVSDGMPISVLQSLAEGCRTVVGPLQQFAEIAQQTDLMTIMRGTTSAAIAEALLGLDQEWASGSARERTTPFVPPIYDRRRNAELVPQFYERVLRGKRV